MVFSMSLAFLNSVEKCLQTDFSLTHSQGYYRIDGSVPPSARSSAINGFNSGVGFKVRILGRGLGTLAFERGGSSGGTLLNVFARKRASMFDLVFEALYYP